MKPDIRRILCLVLLMSLAACSSSAVSLRKVSAKDVVQGFQRNVLASGELSIVSVQTLRQTDLTETAVKNPEAAFSQLTLDPTGPGNFARMFTAIEIAQLQAQNLEKSDPVRALGWYVASGEKAYNLLTAPEAMRLLPFDGRYDHLRLFYLNSIMQTVDILQRTKNIDWANGYDVTLGKETYRLKFEGGEDRFQFADFDELFPAVTVEVEGLRNRHRRPGFGLAFAALRKNQDRSEVERYYPKFGLPFPVSAAIHYDAGLDAPTGSVHPVTLALYDTNKVESITVRGREFTVAADFTAPFALLISKTPLSAALGLKRMLIADEFEKQAGFSMVQPFDPEKIPLITVHGLLSSPLTWIDLHNDLMGDPEIRKKYQIWHFTYSTGAPILYSAKLFREKLDEMYAVLDPQKQYPALKNTIVIAHSMGGLLTHTSVSTSGEAFWEAFFGKRQAELDISADDRKELSSVFNFERREFIKRVVFVAVPHRGSGMAESTIGWIGRKLISLPKRLVGVVGGMVHRIGALMKADVREAFSRDAPTGIQGLSPRNPAIQTLANLPIPVPYHSIIGDQGSGLGKDSSDGVVPYQSSHLEGAQSELIVPADHTAHSSPLAILEIARILRLHLNPGAETPIEGSTSAHSENTVAVE